MPQQKSIWSLFCLFFKRDISQIKHQPKAFLMPAVLLGIILFFMGFFGMQSPDGNNIPLVLSVLILVLFQGGLNHISPEIERGFLDSLLERNGDQSIVIGCYYGAKLMNLSLIWFGILFMMMTATGGVILFIKSMLFVVPVLAMGLMMDVLSGSLPQGKTSSPSITGLGLLAFGPLCIPLMTTALSIGNFEVYTLIVGGFSYGFFIVGICCFSVIHILKPQ